MPPSTTIDKRAEASCKASLRAKRALLTITTGLMRGQVVGLAVGRRSSCMENTA